MGMVALDMKEINFDLNIVTNPYAGIAVYANEIMKRMIKNHTDYRYRGTVCFNTKNKKNLKGLNIPIDVSLLPFGVTYNKKGNRHIPYNFYAHSHSDIYVFWANMIPTLPIKGKIVTAIHDLTPLYLLKNNEEQLKKYRWGINQCLQRSDYVITVSEYTKEDIADKFNYHNNITVIPNGVDFDRFNQSITASERKRVRDKYNLPLKYMFYMGSTYDYKNIKGIIDAISTLPITIRNEYKFVCANSSEQLIQYAKDKKVLTDICFLNGVDEEDKITMYQMAELTLLVSYFEGFGIPIIESMAAGTPIITSNTSSMPEVAGGAALLVSPDSPEDIANAICKIIEDNELKQDLICKGYLNAKKYSWDVSTEKFCEVLRKLI